MTLSGGLHIGIALALLGAGPAAATPTPVSIELDAPAGCSDARAFFDRLRARTDRVRPARPGDDPLRIEVKLVRNGAKVHGELSIKQEPSETAPRAVDGATCDEVVGVLSLTAALALEHMVPRSASGSESGSTTARDGTGATANANGNSANASGASGGAQNSANGDARKPEQGGAAANGARNDRPSPPPDSVHSYPDDGNGGTEANAAWQSSRLRFELGAQVGVVDLVSPLVAVGAGGLIRIRAKGTSLGVSALYWSNDLTSSGDGAKLSALLTALSVCPVSFPLGVHAAFEPCVLGNLGWMHLTDMSAINPRDADRSFWGVGALARLRTEVTPVVGFELEAGASFPLVKRRFVTSMPERMVAETPWISPVIGLSAVLSP